MFNFDLLNEAVFDTKLTDKEFRLLYVIANNAAMNKVNTVQLNNGWLMDKLDCCERQIRRLTNGLNQKGYVIKTVTGTSKNKNSNTYTLERTLQEDKNVPPKTSENREKNEVKPQYDDKNVDKNVPPKTSENREKNEVKPQYDDKNVDKNVPPKNNKKIKENINNLSTKDINDSRRMVTEEKEKINKKESCYGDSLQSGTPEDNTINVFNNSSSGVGDSPLAETPEDSVKVFSNIPSGDGESSQSSTVGNEDITSSGMEEENNPQPESSNNGAGRTLTPQVEQETTPHEKMQENAPQTAKNASLEKMTTQTVENEPQNVKNNAPERAQNDQTPHGTDNSTSEGRIRKLRENITLQLKLLEESCRMKKAPLFKARLKELKELLKGLERISPSEFNEAHEQWRLWHKEHKKFYPKGWDVDEEQQSRLAVEKLRYQDYISSIRLAKTFDDITTAVIKISNWSNRISSVFKPSDVEALMNMSNDDYTRLSQTVPLFKDWVKAHADD